MDILQCDGRCFRPAISQQLAFGVGFLPAFWGLCAQRFPKLPLGTAYASMPQNSGLGASMAEESEGQGTGAEASRAGVDPAALALAMGAAAQNERVAAQAEVFLKKQSALVDLQAKELAHELSLRHWSLWVRHASGLLKLALELSAGLLLLFAVTAIGVMVWNAAHADGLVIEEFSVPADMAAKGLTGQVVATQMLDKLTDMQNLTRSVRAPRTYANNWGSDLKVEIPETGISVGEAYRFLTEWLGHETHISGEVYRTASGIAVTARSGGDSGATFAGAETELDALEQKAAENIYGSSQPHRFNAYLGNRGRVDEAIAFGRALVRTGSAAERAWADVGLGVNYQLRCGPDADQDLTLFRRASELDPTNGLAASNLAGAERIRGYFEQALIDSRKSLGLLNGPGQGQFRGDTVPAFRQLQQANIDSLLGDFSGAALAEADYVQSGQATASGISAQLAGYQAQAHDPSTARATMADPLPETPGRVLNGARLNGETRIEMAGMAQDWAGVLSEAAAMQRFFLANPGMRANHHLVSEPRVAIAEARLGRVADAEALVSDMPGDCYPCLRARAQVAEAKGDHAAADVWFTRAVAAAPSIPFANSEWGSVLLDRGQPDAAIEKFKLANQKGPHFADPLEGWGEALMKKNQSHLALAKFEEADKYAPNWGRLHLMWGEALGYAGRKDEAQKQYALAAGLDMSAADKAELAKVSHG